MNIYVLKISKQMKTDTFKGKRTALWYVLYFDISNTIKSASIRT